jgi:hypothetical protein
MVFGGLVNYQGSFMFGGQLVFWYSLATTLFPISIDVLLLQCKSIKLGAEEKIAKTVRWLVARAARIYAYLRTCKIDSIQYR